DIFGAIEDLQKKHLEELLASRSIDDVGRESIESETIRKNLVDLFLANTQRAKESLRVLEEVSKLFGQNLSKKFKRFRFRIYDIEKAAVKDLEKIMKKR
ncbi:MAG: hypothetical protein WBC99_06665, partial [Candidatus Omnitrophota bacterium]